MLVYLHFIFSPFSSEQWLLVHRSNNHDNGNNDDDGDDYEFIDYGRSCQNVPMERKLTTTVKIGFRQIKGDSLDSLSTFEPRASL